MDGCGNTCHHGLNKVLMSKVMAKCQNIFMKILIILSPKWAGTAMHTINDLVGHMANQSPRVFIVCFAMNRCLGSDVWQWKFMGFNI